MKSSVVVYTCLTAAREPLREDQLVSLESAREQFVAFVDTRVETLVWEQKVIETTERSARRSARYIKLLAHRHIDSEFSLWQDANVALRVPLSQLCTDWLTGYDLAVFRHRTRDCLYKEAQICKEKLLDDPEIIDQQTARYRTDGFPENAGLAETSVVLRRHSARMERFNELWWEELSAGSVRDQISFMVAAKKAGIRVRLVTPTKFEHPYFSMTVRPPGREGTFTQRDAAMLLSP